MGLRIPLGRDGKMRETWWGRFSIKGAVRDTNLNVKVEGRVPTNADGRPVLSEKGDEAFERSRRAAQKAFEKWRRESRKDPAELAAKAYRARTGVDVESVALVKLADLWENQKRTYEPTRIWRHAVHTWFDRFSAFARTYAKAHGSKCEVVNDITPELAAAWFDDLRETFAWETVAKQMSLMRAAFRRYSTSGKPNPFDDIIMRNRETENARISRRPLTEHELARLLDFARADENVYPLIVCAACTGMRIGDVCNLKWENVGLKNGLIDVTTAKTGKRVTIPIFDRLREVLDAQQVVEADGAAASPYVFPKAARHYAQNPDGVYRSAKPFFAQAVYGDESGEIGTEQVEVVEADAGGDGAAADASIVRDIEESIRTSDFTQKRRESVLAVYRLFKSGKKSARIADELGISRSRVSMYLADAETLTGERLRPLVAIRNGRLTKHELEAKTRQARGIGKRSASVYGWHSLRATFVVLAVEAGVPLPNVQKIVGHSTADMTMQYYNPTQKHEAERVRNQMRGSILNTRSDDAALLANARAVPMLTLDQTADAAAGAAVAARTATADPLDALLGGLTDEQRRELARRLNVVQHFGG